MRPDVTGGQAARRQGDPVTGVARPAPGRIVLVIAQVLAHLLSQRPLQHRLGHLRQQVLYLAVRNLDEYRGPTVGTRSSGWKLTGKPWSGHFTYAADVSRAAEIADELYALSPDEFTAARDAAAKQARDDGDRELATEIKQFRRPTIGAWLVNQVVRANDDRLDQLLDLGAALREAQDALDGAELRAMSRQRHQVIRALSSLAHNVTGKKIADAAQREFEATLDAALSDEAAANAVRTGRLMRPLATTGLEPVDLTDAVAVPSDTPAPKRPAKKQKPKPDDTAQRTKREAERKRAEQALEDAQAALDEHQRAAEQARETTQAAKSHVAALEQQLDEAREAHTAAETARKTADAELKTAARARDAAQRALDTARKRE
jgi:hypothetical protein